MNQFVSEMPILIRVDSRGSLGVVEFLSLPFMPKRFFYLFDVSIGGKRGGHAHKEQWQFLFCQSGSFKVRAQGFRFDATFMLKDPSVGILVPPGFWLDLWDFQANSICGVFASDKYIESDYIRDFQKFLDHVKATN